jgi:hypothetical protein
MSHNIQVTGPSRAAFCGWVVVHRI